MMMKGCLDEFKPFNTVPVVKHVSVSIILLLIICTVWNKDKEGLITSSSSLPQLNSVKNGDQTSNNSSNI